jgi:N-acetylmuramoyl-L-alanine amidase
MTWADWDVAITALCAWREARGEGREGMRAVMHVIRNRAEAASHSWADVVSVPWQFSSLTARGDPELTLWPVHGNRDWESFETAMQLAADISEGIDAEDITGGATHYIADSIEPPAWANNMVQTAKIGHHRFFK